MSGERCRFRMPPYNRLLGNRDPLLTELCSHLLSVGAGSRKLFLSHHSCKFRQGAAAFHNLLKRLSKRTLEDSRFLHVIQIHSPKLKKKKKKVK